MKILVCGSRTFKDRELIKKALGHLTKGESEVVIVQGEAQGADTLAKEIAEENGWAVKGYPADWGRWKKAAGPIRNKEMLDSNPDIDIVLAFSGDIEKSKGTKNMIFQSNKAGVPVLLCSSKTEVNEVP